METGKGITRVSGGASEVLCLDLDDSYDMAWLTFWEFITYNMYIFLYVIL